MVIAEAKEIGVKMQFNSFEDARNYIERTGIFSDVNVFTVTENGMVHTYYKIEM